jgi:hypothetical protein
MSLFLPSLAAITTALAVEGKPVPDEDARQTAARVRASMLTGNWAWLHDLDTETRNPILVGLGRWTIASSTIEILALRLNILCLAGITLRGTRLVVSGAAWEEHWYSPRWVGSVRSWGNCPYEDISFREEDFWQFVSERVGDQETQGSGKKAHFQGGHLGKDGSRFWFGITPWSWDGDRGLLLVEREDIEPPRRFVITPMPKGW